MMKKFSQTGDTNNNRKAQRKVDMKTTKTDCTHEFTRLTQWLWFNNFCLDCHEMTASPLDSARSDYLHTMICSVVTKKRISSLHDSDCCLNNIWPSFTQTGLDRCCHTNNTCSFCARKPHQFHQRLLTTANCTSSISVCKSLASANHTSSSRIPRSSPDLGYPAWCSTSFHLTSPRSILGGLFLLTAVIWNGNSRWYTWQLRQDHYDHSHTNPESVIRLAYVSHVPH